MPMKMHQKRQYLNDPSKACSKAPICSRNYQSKISGPILDRFDLHIEVGNSDEHYTYDHILNPSNEESSADVAVRVKNARQIQAERYEGYNIRLNNALDGQLLIDYAIPGDEVRDILNEAAKKFGLSMRAYNRVLRVARTIADCAPGMVNR